MVAQRPGRRRRGRIHRRARRERREDTDSSIDITEVAEGNLSTSSALSARSAVNIAPPRRHPVGCGGTPGRGEDYTWGGGGSTGVTPAGRPRSVPGRGQRLLLRDAHLDDVA